MTRDPSLKEEAIAAAPTRLANDDGYRIKLKSLSKSQALKFSWELCAAQVMDIYSEVMELPKRDG
jgi:glycosyltransferase involved in cell wall biosynthesis